MQYFDFILRFDNELHSLTARNGLSLSELSDLLTSLSKAVHLDKDEKLILSEIRGNCYALSFSTNSSTTFNCLKVIHKEISENNYTGLNNYQRSYASTLNKLTINKYTIDAYDKDKNYHYKIREIEFPARPNAFYEVSTISGVITKIGGGTLSGKSTIHVENIGFDIFITTEQEGQLLKYFKNGSVRLSVNKRIDTETKEVKSAELISFTLIGEHGFAKTGKKIRDNIGNDFFTNLDQSLIQR